MSGQPPRRYLIPVEGLVVPAAWRIGNVVIHPGSKSDGLLGAAPPFSDPAGIIESEVMRIVRSAVASSVAEVPHVDGVDRAIDEVGLALDALRLFQQSRAMVRTTAFGLPGDLRISHIEYVAVWDRSAHGFRNRGHHGGWRFNDIDLRDWEDSPSFQFLSEALTDPTASTAADRARRGLLLFSRAAMEHRPDLKMVGYVSALEAWLLDRQSNSQTLRLARYATWFGCGAHDGQLCGRASPICPYLYLRPGDKSDRTSLKHLAELGNTRWIWRCSEWHRITDWYEARSDAAHGDPYAVEKDHADEAGYWIAHMLAPSILDWLRTHRADPSGDLEREIDAIPRPSDWPEMLAAIGAQAPSPPTAR